MTKIMTSLKPAAALVTSAMLGAFLVLGAVTMLGNAAHTAPSVSEPRAVEGLGRFNTTDIRVAAPSRPAAR
ncbi:MAG: hypothetical protein FJY92_12785 [Candidatus Hydrogenedentes bacterium]|nr:hypothetical protein [Candidatus Hydrogenedentota bacterium]